MVSVDPLEVDDWSVVALCVVVELGLVMVDCWLALAPLVTVWSPLPTFTPGLMFAPAFTDELLTPTLASTPTFGFTLSVLLLDEEGDVVLLKLDGVVVLLALPEADGDVVLVLDEALEPGVTLMSVLLTLLLDDEGDVPPCEPLRLVLLDEELEPGVTLMSVLFRLLLEDDEGVLVVVDGLPDVPRFSVVDESVVELVAELPLSMMAPPARPPFTVSVVTVLEDWLNGTLGMQPAGWVFAASMHLGSACDVLYVVIVSARATPKAAIRAAARRLRR